MDGFDATIHRIQRLFLFYTVNGSTVCDQSRYVGGPDGIDHREFLFLLDNSFHTKYCIEKIRGKPTFIYHTGGDHEHSGNLEIIVC